MLTKTFMASWSGEACDGVGVLVGLSCGDGRGCEDRVQQRSKLISTMVGSGL